MTQAEISEPKSRVLLVSNFACGETVFEQLQALSRWEAIRWSGDPADLNGVDFELVEGFWLRPDTLFTSELTYCFPNLKFVATTSTSVAHIDTRSLETRGVKVIKLESSSDGLDLVTSTVDLTWSLILAAHCRMHEAVNATKSGRWDSRAFVRPRQLRSSSLGIVGFGRIGSRVARVGASFDMEVNAYDPFLSSRESERLLSDGVRVFCDLNSLFEASDIVSIHASSGHENYGLISASILESANGVSLINTSRGELVDEGAVVQSLRRGLLSSYSADVGQFENSEMSLLDSVLHEGIREGLRIVLTPHIGGLSRDAMQFTEEVILGKIRAEGH